MIARKSKAIRHTRNSWWHSSLFIGLLCAAIGGGLGLIPWIYDKHVQREIINDNIGSTFLFTNPQFLVAPSINRPSHMDIRLFASSFGDHMSWISINRGIDGRMEIINSERVHHNGDFSAVFRNLPCNSSFNFRVEGLFENREVSARLSSITLPSCQTSQEIRQNYQSHPFFRSQL